jgi:hypothetical protein
MSAAFEQQYTESLRRHPRYQEVMNLAAYAAMKQRLEELMRRCREERHEPTYADLQGLLGSDA